MSIEIIYKYVDGAHFFVSNDKMAYGLCVAHKDLRTAFQSLSPALSKLFLVNHGVTADFKPQIKYAEFRAIIEKWLDVGGNSSRHVAVRPGGFVDWSQAA